jgi:predicted NBD/HSP70 family sugar kinase
MVDEGLLEASGVGRSTGGRRATTYSIKSDSIYILSVAMDQMISNVSMMDIRNNHIIGIEEFQLVLIDNPFALESLYEKIEEVISKCGVDRNKIIGVGIGMPGFIDFKKGENYSFVSIEGKSVTKYLSEKLQMPVYLDNDSSLIALAEFRFGAARNRNHSMVINIGWGVGLGMILNGELFRGHNGFAGEFSHMPLFNNNKLCQCGKTGCLETESSLMVLLEKAKIGLTDGRLSTLKKDFNTGDLEKDWKEIVNAAMVGDQFVIKILSEIAYNIGKGVAILIHLINPELVILSGRGAAVGNLWLAPIQQALNEHCIPRLSANTSIGLSSLSDHALLIGCSTLVMEHLNSDPNIYKRISSAITPKGTELHSR